MKERSVSDNTRDSARVLRLGLLTYAGVFLLTTFAATFVRLTVYPTVQWSLQMQTANKLPRVFAASSLAGITLAVVIMTGMVVIRWYENSGDTDA